MSPKTKRQADCSGHERGAASRQASTRLSAADHSRSVCFAARFPRLAGDSGVLSGRLESGLRRSDGTVQRDLAGISPLPRGAAWYFGRRRLVSPGVREGSQVAISAAVGLRAERKDRHHVRGLPAAGWRLRARCCLSFDSGGVIRWSYVSPIGVNPGADGILNALEELSPQPQEKRDEHPFNRQARALSERS